MIGDYFRKAASYFRKDKPEDLSQFPVQTGLVKTYSSKGKFPGEGRTAAENYAINTGCDLFQYVPDPEYEEMKRKRDEKERIKRAKNHHKNLATLLRPRR